MHNRPLPICTDCAKSPPNWAEGTPQTQGFLAMSRISPLIRSALMPPAPWRTLLLVTALASVAVTGGACAQQTSDPVVARVNGVDIRSSDLAIAEEEVGANLPAMPPGEKDEDLGTCVSQLLPETKAAAGQ